jgi:ribosome modulation factor
MNRLQQSQQQIADSAIPGAKLMLNEAAADGWDAYFEGWSESDNPYYLKENADAWLDGFRRAQLLEEHHGQH